MIDDKAILKAMAELPNEGFRLLMSHYQQPIYWHIRRIVVVSDDAQDATQETFVRVFTSFAQFDSTRSLKTWIFRIATNEALRLLKRRQSLYTLSIDDDEAPAIDLAADPDVDTGDALALRLQQAIHTLPPKQQLAFNLRYYDELTYDEIADVMESTAAAAKVNYHLAKEKIIRFMNQNDYTRCLTHLISRKSVNASLIGSPKVALKRCKHK